MIMMVMMDADCGILPPPPRPLFLSDDGRHFCVTAKRYPDFEGKHPLQVLHYCLVSTFYVLVVSGFQIKGASPPQVVNGCSALLRKVFSKVG